MRHVHHSHGARVCPECDRVVDLTHEGRYRRHFLVEPDGRRALCAGSGLEASDCSGS